MVAAFASIFCTETAVQLQKKILFFPIFHNAKWSTLTMKTNRYA